MTKMKKFLSIVGTVLLVASLVLSLACCGKPGNNDPSTEPGGEQGENLTHTVCITNEAGAALEGVGVYVYEDESLSELVWFDKTDAKGQMSFDAPESDSYVAVLSDLPTGTITEQDFYPITGTVTTIALKIGVLDDINPEDVRYALGDTVMDFTVVDTNGDEYKLSELLQQKKAVVLNFWYVECNPCRAEFPYLQEAYEQYQNDVAVIAMNPVNTKEEDIAAFKSELGLTFPVVMADAQWADMLQLTAYPTTVVIDRFGVVSMIHKGSIDNADTFRQMFEYFAAEDYVQGVVENLEDILTEEEEETLGTAENPDQQGATGTKLTLKPGQEYHLQFYKASGMYMNVTGSDFYVIYNGKKTQSSAGYVGMLVESEGIYYPVEIIIGNPTEKEQNISVAFGALKGTSGNPYKLALGEFTMNTAAGNEEGVFGTYTAEESGTLTVRCMSSSVSRYGFYLYNLRSYAMRNTDEDGAHDEDGYLYTSVQVKKGDKISFSVAVARDEDNFISAGAFRFELKLDRGDGEEDKKAEAPKTAYSITVNDQDGNAVAGVGVNLKGAFTYEPTENDPEGLEPTEVKVDLNLTTDAEGHIISEQVTGPYTATIRVPEGYRLEQTEYTLDGETNTVTVQLEKIVMVDYVITVVDAEGNPVSGVSLMMGASFGTTNEEGVYTVNLEEAEQSVFVFAGVPEGYVTPTDAFLIPVGESQLTIQLEKEAEPEPEYTDIFGEFPIVTEQLAPGQKAYYNVYNAGGANLVIEDADAFVVIGEVTYEAVDGVVSVPVPVTMGRMPVQIVIGNGGAETESYTANVVFPVGSQQNPDSLILDDFTVQLAEGNSTGYNYSWTSAADGVLTIVYTGETGVAGETFEVMLTNTTSYVCPLMSESEDGKTVSVAVKAGEQVTVLVSTIPNENWEYPAGTVALSASFGEAHVHDYAAVVTEPTCTEGGYTTYTCACGDSYVGDEVAALGHKYEAVVTAPTCTAEGYTTYTCACGDGYVGDKVAALGHKYEAAVTAPTCTAEGYTTYTCVCGDQYTADETPALGHDYVSEVIEPTITAEGYTLHVCSRCGHSYKDSFTDKLPAPPHDHSYTAVVTAPTCTEEGYTTYTCACGDSYVGDKVAALGHQYEAVVTAPTCTAGGYTTFTCTVCKHSYAGEEVAALGHKYEAVVTAPTCTEEGYTTYTCVCGDSCVGDKVAALGHQYEAVVTAPTCTAGGYTTFTCAVCEDSYVGDKVDATGHKHEAVVIEPTCTTEGHTIYTCACGDSYVDDRVEALGHDYVSQVIEPTTATEGYTLHTCSRCDHSYKDNYTAKLPENPEEPPHVHTYTTVVTAPTCTEGGYTTYTCACGHSYVGNEVAALGHNYEAVVTAPTCTAGGYTTYTCSVCEDSYVGDEVEAIGHKYEAVVTAPTCTEGGYTTYTCSVCEDSYVGDEVEATGHKYEAIVTAPTCTAEGYTTYTCACGDSYVGDKVAATGHKYEAVVTAPTCTAGGYTTYTCTVCKDSYVGDEVAALGHKYEAVVTAPTCTAAGYTTYTCVCGDTYKANEVQALGHDFRNGECVRCGEKDLSYKELTAGIWTYYELPDPDGDLYYYRMTFKDGTFSYVTDSAYNIKQLSSEMQADLREDQPARLIEFEGETYVTPMASGAYTGTYVVNEDGTITLTGAEHFGGGTVLQYAAGDQLEEIADKGINLPGKLSFEEKVHKHLFPWDASCTEAKECVGCGLIKEEALGHDYVSEVIAPTTSSEGYTQHTCSRCGDSYKDNYTEKLPEVSTTVNYCVTVTDFDGTPMAGVAVQILSNNAPVKVGVTDANGKLTAELDPGDYTVKLAFSTTGNHYEEKTAVLSAAAPELKILVTSAVPTPVSERHWMLGKVSIVELGGTYVTTQKNAKTYFLFTPTEEGTYRFTTSDPEAIISYWGGENFPSDQTANTDYKDNVFTLSINQSYIGQTYVLGVTGADDCILIIERQGAAAFDPNEVPYTAYELAEKPEAFTLEEEGTLTYVDMSADAADVKPVLGSDGYYHLGTADGPVLYVCLGGQAPYIPLYTMCGGGGVTGAPFRYTDYSDYDNLIKEDYTQCILDYGACMDKTYGVYPLTADLIHILPRGVEHIGWADPDHPNFQFSDVQDYNPELGWMFAICYLEK